MPATVNSDPSTEEVKANHTPNRHVDESLIAATTKAFDQTATLESSQKYYNEIWSDSYDADVQPIGYAGPRELARVLQYVANHLGTDDRPQDLRILDVGCGTGLLGEELKAHKFTNIDGLDASPKMLDKARVKGIYGKLYEAFVNTDDKPIADIEPETYDIVAAVGAFVHAHIPAEGLRQVLKLVKRNSGMLALGSRRVMKNDGERKYVDEMAKLQQKMLIEGLIEVVFDEIVERYVNYHGWEDGRLVVFRRLK